MLKSNIEKIKNEAQLIVSGYAFLPREDGFIGILNLEHPDCAIVINKDCEIIETNMDSIEQNIVLGLAKKNLQFLSLEGHNA
ncbi:MAG: hypothetical protein K6F15_10065 [Treponema sp.]|nr:hypothetical protein [Treponema sp.]MCR5495968.1 hypothetical protein [Treponema sp.]